MRYLLSLLFLAFLTPAQAQPAPQPALDGVFAAFRSHALVGLGEHHRIQQELDFYSAVIRDPRFAAEVGNVMVEFGGAAHQDIIDRYVNGEEIPYAELRKVWTDTVGWMPVVTGAGYPAFFAQVRETNQKLPPEKRIHVWLGEPVIDWSKVTHAEWLALNRQRDDFAAAVIEREILAHEKKALIIYGGAHFEPPVPGSAGAKLVEAGQRNSVLADMIRRNHPDALYVALFYSGTANKDCAHDIEKDMTGWPVPALLSPARDSFIARKLRACSTLKVEDGGLPPGLTNTQKQQIVDLNKDAMSYADAILYVGPSGDLTYSPYMPDLYLDAAYGRTVALHYQLQMGQPMPSYPVRDYTVPKKVRP